MSPAPDLERLILEACTARGAGRSLCPSEVARALGAERWREWMPAVRAAAARLAAAGRIRVTRRGAEVDAESPGGPIRLRIVPGGASGRRSVPGSG